MSELEELWRALVGYAGSGLPDGTPLWLDLDAGGRGEPLRLDREGTRCPREGSPAAETTSRALIAADGRQFGTLWLGLSASELPAPERLDALTRGLSAALSTGAALGSIALDELTGLPGRPLLAHRFPPDSPFTGCVVAVDIDDLATLNHRHGCEVGDDLLRAVGRTLSAQRPPGAVSIRDGADDFLLIWPGATEPERSGWTRTVSDILASNEMLLAAGATVSIGSATAEREPLSTVIGKARTATHGPSSGGSDPLAGLLSGNWGRDHRNVSLLLETIDAANALVDPEQIMCRVVDQAVELSGTERGMLFVVDGDGLELRVARGRHRRALPLDASHATSVVERALRTGLSTSLADAAPADWEPGESVYQLGLHAVLGLPIRARGQERVQGVLYLDGRRHSAFAEQDVRFLEALARQICSQLERARLEAQVHELTEQLRRELADTSAELARARSDMARQFDFGELVSRSPAMREAFAVLERVVDTGLPVLIEGESGTGKELTARALHCNGSRAAGPFVAENCAAIAETLLESELFGYCRGAFSGATSDKPGLIEKADGGTLLLDEIGEISEEMQKKLLRFLQEGEYRPVGGTEVRRADVRIISSTNRDLLAEVEAGRFRADLYYRLNVVRVYVPPLRERPEDIPTLARHLMDKHAQLLGLQAPSLTDGALAWLMCQRWPGNVRELENVIQRALIMCRSPELEEQELIEIAGARMPAVPAGTSLPDALRAIERQLLLRALQESLGNRSEAARGLGIPRSTLQDRLRKHALMAYTP